MSETLGGLSSYVLGATVSFTIGGATYRGTLTSVEHKLSWKGDHLTRVGLKDDSWRYTGSHPSDTPVDVVYGVDGE